MHGRHAALLEQAQIAKVSDLNLNTLFLRRPLLLTDSHLSVNPRFKMSGQSAGLLCCVGAISVGAHVRSVTRMDTHVHTKVHLRGSPVRTHRSGARKRTLTSVRAQMHAQLCLRCKCCCACRESAWTRLTTKMRRQVRREETAPLKNNAAVGDRAWETGHLLQLVPPSAGLIWR